MRKKSEDLALIRQFVADLEEFSRLKQTRWEMIDEEVQKDIWPGVPSEDWIIPPDEKLAEVIFEKDPDYVRLKTALLRTVPQLRSCAHFLGLDVHHDFDWINFNAPLIGSAALADALHMAKRLEATCSSSWYCWRNFKEKLI